LDKIKAMGATCIRQMLYMHRLDPCGAKFLENLRRYEHLVDAANARRLKVELVITGVASTWGAAVGSNGKPCGLPKGINPTPSDLRKFIDRVVPLFARKNVTRFSIWNEPNIANWLCNGTVKTNSDGKGVQCQGSTLEGQAKLYRALYIAAWNKIQSLKKAKKIPARTKVIFGEVYGSNDGLKFLRLATRGKNGLKAHGMATHPYQYCFAPNKRSFNFPHQSCKLKQVGGMGWTGEYIRLAKSLAKAGRLQTPKKRTVPVYLTEFGYLKAGEHQLPEKIRAKWYRRAMTLAKTKGVAQMTIYQLYPRASGWDFGLLNKDGSALPSYIALQVWARENGYLRIVKPKPKS